MHKLLQQLESDIDREKQVIEISKKIIHVLQITPDQIERMYLNNIRLRCNDYDISAWKREFHVGDIYTLEIVETGTHGYLLKNWWNKSTDFKGSSSTNIPPEHVVDFVIKRLWEAGT